MISSENCTAPHQQGRDCFHTHKNPNKPIFALANEVTCHASYVLLVTIKSIPILWTNTTRAFTRPVGVIFWGEKGWLTDQTVSRNLMKLHHHVKFLSMTSKKNKKILNKTWPHMPFQHFPSRTSVCSQMYKFFMQVSIRPSFYFTPYYTPQYIIIFFVKFKCLILAMTQVKCSSCPKEISI